MRRALFVMLGGFALLLITALPSFGGLSQQQRAQQTVYILVNVTNPLAKADVPQTHPAVIAARIALHAKGSVPSVTSELPALRTMLAQAAQTGVRVQAEVTPNPNATLLVTNQTNLSLNQTAGTTVVYPCAFTVTSNAGGVSLWTIRQGLASDFISGTWPGRDLANNVHLSPAPPSTPQPTATPYMVYPSAWTNAASSQQSGGGNIKTYCVDLTLTVPSNVATGSYSTTAVYTLWY